MAITNTAIAITTPASVGTLNCNSCVYGTPTVAAAKLITVSGHAPNVESA